MLLRTKMVRCVAYSMSFSCLASFWLLGGCLQVLIRWALQRGTSCLPKSANPGRIAANFDVLDWQLQSEDQQALDTLPYRVSKHGMVDLPI
jgi:hypothetical protein